MVRFHARLPLRDRVAERIDSFCGVKAISLVRQVRLQLPQSTFWPVWLNWLEHGFRKAGVPRSNRGTGSIFFCPDSSMIEQPSCTRQVTGLSPVPGSNFGRVAEWLKATVLKAVRV